MMVLLPMNGLICREGRCSWDGRYAVRDGKGENTDWRMRWGGLAFFTECSAFRSLFYSSANAFGRSAGIIWSSRNRSERGGGASLGAIWCLAWRSVVYTTR